MTPALDFSVFIGRFQPFHNGHLKIVQEGLARASKLIVVIGSAYQPRSTRDPWTHIEREQMIRACLSDADNARLICAPLIDVRYNLDIWVRNVQSTINDLVDLHHNNPDQPAHIALIGHPKDQTSFYLNLFPQWSSINVDNYCAINATPMREHFFINDAQQVINNLLETDVLPLPVAKQLIEFASNSECYQHVRDEFLFIKTYQEAWKAAPYAPTFVTVDALVVQSGHILLIERRDNPGKGLWALPGGFLDQNERLQDACIRELHEETQLDVAPSQLKSAIKHNQVYDDPHRSARGRTITHVFYIELEPNEQLPTVKGSDDAKTARWIPLSQIDPQQMFEDHYFIIQNMLGTL